MVPFAARAPFSLLVALMLVRFADEWFSFFPSGSLEAIRSDLGLSYARIGLVVAAQPAGGLLGTVFSIAADYVDRRLLASLGAFVSGLGLLAFATSHAFIALLLAGFVWGLAGDALIAGTEITLVELYPESLAPVLARVNAYGAVGDLLGPLTLAGAAALGFGWRSVFALGGALLVLYAASFAGQTFPTPRPRPDGKGVVAGVVSVAQNRLVLRLALIDALFGLLDEPFQGYTLAYFERDRGLAPALATLIIAGWVVAGVVGFLAVPIFSRRSSDWTLLRGFGVVIAVAVGVLVAAPIVSLQALAALTFGFAAAVFYSVLQAAVLGAEPGRAGTINAVVSTIGTFGIAFPSLVGVVVDDHGLQAGLGLYALIPLLILTLLRVEWQKDSAA